MKIESICVYPVKALRCVYLDSAQVTKHGFPHDRRFIILQVERKNGATQYKTVGIAHYPMSILLWPSLDEAGKTVTLTYKPPPGEGEAKSVDFPLYPFTDDLEAIEIDMHKSPTKCYKMPQQYNDWLSSIYGFEAVLAYLGPHYRAVKMSSTLAEQQQQQDSKTNGASNNSSSNGWLSALTATAASYLNPGRAPAKAEITFADVAPYLICSSRSMDDLHPRLPAEAQPFDIMKFRPNIIVSGADEPWDEDFWGEIRIGAGADAARIECVHNCGRCKSINIDYETGRPGEGPAGQMLKQMQRDRRVDPGTKYSPVFGRYSFLREGEGNVVRVGDEVEVTKKLQERTRFDWEGLCT